VTSLYWALVGGVVGYVIGSSLSLLIFHICLKRYGP
jgi:hypothetical protein